MSIQELLQVLEFKVQSTVDKINEVVKAGSETWKRRSEAWGTNPSLYEYIIQYPDWEAVSSSYESIKSGYHHTTLQELEYLVTLVDSFYSNISNLKDRLAPEPFRLIFDEVDVDVSTYCESVELAAVNNQSRDGNFYTPPAPFFHFRRNSFP